MMENQKSATQLGKVPWPIDLSKKVKSGEKSGSDFQGPRGMYRVPKYQLEKY